MIQWRKVSLAYPCEACGAPPGSPCISLSGKPKYEIHQRRADVASANGWRDPECGTLPLIDPTGAGVDNASSS
jgi:hypothetical protein